MILVTVGTSLPHDELIRKIDQIVGNREIEDEVIAQIGAGNYIPQKIKYFRFARGLDRLYEICDIVISNCGAGTILENVIKGRKLIIIQNPDITGGHEWELATKMEKGNHLVWCRSLDDLKESINKVKKMKMARFEPEKLNIKEVLRLLMTNDW